MLDFEILGSYTFLVVAAGTFLLSTAAGAVGCINVLKGESLIGDAIGHSAFPGIVLSFMLFMQRSPLLLLLGAVVSGSTAFFLIQCIHSNSKLQLDAALAVVLSSFFGMGMVLKSYIQGNPDFSKASQSGLQSYIFGQASYIMRSDICLLLPVSLLSLLLLLLFYKELKLFVFDREYAETLAIPSGLMYFIDILMTMSLIAAGLKLVGSILISSLLLIPAIAALQWSKRFDRVLILAALFGGLSALAGTYVSTLYEGMSTGPTIISIMSLLAFISMLFGPHGIIANIRLRRRFLK